MRLIEEGQRLAQVGTHASLAEAIDKDKAAFACFQKDNLKEGMTIALFASGAAYSTLGQKRRALDAFLEASTYAKQIGEPSIYAMILAGIGLAYTDLNEWNRAIEFLDQALPMLQSAKNPQAVVSVLCGLGGTYIKRGQKQKGLEYLASALIVAEEVHDPGLEVSARLLIGAGLSSSGQKRRALESIELALKLAREQKDPLSEATCLLSLGQVHDSLGDKHGALRNYADALRVGLTVPGWTGKGPVINNIGSIYADLGETDRAFALYEESIRASDAEGQPEEAGNSLNGMAGVYDLRAEPLKALDYYKRALGLARALKHQGREAGTLVNIARVYDSFGEHEQALKANQDAAAVFRAIEDPEGESIALSNQGTIYNKLRRYPEALDRFNRALDIEKASENRREQAYTLKGLGDTYRGTGDVVKALDAYTEALHLTNALEDRAGEAAVSNEVGSAYDLQGNYEKAAESYRSALSLARSAADRRGEATVLGNLGFLLERRGDLKQAEDMYRLAIEARERIRTGARLDEFKSAVADESAELYSRAIRLKVRTGKLVEAFELSEKARARTFLDQVGNVHLDFKKGADPELVAQEQSLRLDIVSLDEELRKERLNNPSSEGVRLITASIKDKEEAYSALLIRLKASNPDYAQLQTSPVIPLSEIQSLLGTQTTAVSYFVTAEKTFAFVVDSRSLQVVEIPVKEAQLRTAIDWFRAFPCLGDLKPQSLKQLHVWLIQPILQYIKTSEVAIIPHGILHYLPFGALTDGQRYFGEDHAIYYLPSASILPALRRRIHPEGKAVLAAAQSRAEGLPALRYADGEAAAVAELYHSRPMPTGHATKAEFLKRAEASSILHIAAHAELNAHSPLFSRILLTPDKDDNGAIEVREVYGMDLTKTNLVVLSACETQLGAHSGGDDIVGLNRAFIYAGAPSIIASLWTVDDEFTSFLMKAFYTHLKSGMSKAEALQAAQSDTRKRYPHPYYWAGFVLTGDPGRSRKK